MTEKNMCDSKKILMVTYSSPDKLGRLQRNVDFLIKQGYLVDILCNLKVTHSGVNQVFYFQDPDYSIKARFLRKLAVYLRLIIPFVYIKNILTDYILRENSIIYDLVVNYDVFLLEHIDFLRPVIECKKKDSKVIFDNKDYFPREFELHKSFMLLEAPYRKYIFRKYLNLTDGVISVSKGLQDLLKSEYGIESILLPNAQYYQNLNAQVCVDDISFVHSGTDQIDRGIFQLIDCQEFKEYKSLDLYLINVDNQIKNISKRINNSDYKIRLRKPVPIKDIVTTLNNYDVAIIFFPKESVNNYLSLPNKFFEAIQSRLMIIVNNVPDMANLVTQYDLGIVISSFSMGDLNDCIKNITPEIVMKHKRKVHEAAKVLCFENYEKDLLNLFKRIKT